MNGRFISSLILSIVVMAVSVISSNATTADELQTLKVGKIIEATVQKGKALSFALTSSNGDDIEGTYIQGIVESGDHPVSLILQTSSGKHLRQMLDNSTHQKEFFLITGNEPEQLILKSNSNHPAPIKIQLTHNVPNEKQLNSKQLPPPELISPTLIALSKALKDGGTTNAFWEKRRQQGAPMVEPSPEGKSDEVILTFLWRGAKQNVRLWGSPSNDHEWLAKLGTSDIWFKSFKVPNTLRLSYKFAPDIPLIPGTKMEQRRALLSVLQADPLNKHPLYKNAPDKFNQNSYVALSKAPFQHGLYGTPKNKGQLQSFTFESKILNNKRSITIYTPHNYNKDAPDNLLLFMFDGKAYQQEKAPIPHILDNLIDQNKLAKTVAVFIDVIDSKHRAKELPCNKTFANMMANELLGEVLKHTGLKHNPVRTIIAGSSYGGLAAACLAYRHPASFGNFISMSGSFWWAPKTYSTQSNKLPYLASLFNKAPLLPIRAYLTAGTYETSRNHEHGILNTNRKLHDILKSKGYSTATYNEFTGGHDYAVWRGSLADGLMALFPKK